MNKRQQHEIHMLIYAVDSNGILVNVDNVNTGNKCGCFCPACKEPLTAKNKGKKRIHHFAHQSGTECEFAYESMLHLLAKEKVRNVFLNNDEFWMNLVYKSYCPKSNQCVYVRYNECKTTQQKRFNLKNYYDSCEQEVCYDNIKRRSDLKIYSSKHPEREPIYIEFCVTHASDDAKLHSGNKIIEILIEDEYDIHNLTEKGFIEKKPFNIYTKQMPSKINFYGFKQKDYNNQTINSNIEFVRYVLYQSGKIRCYHDSGNCKEIKRASQYSLFEMRFHTSVSFGIYDYAKYVGFKKFGIINCCVCQNYVDNYNGLGKMCRLYKHLQIPRYENIDTSRAKSCHCFTLNKEDMEQKLRSGSPAFYDIL